MRRSTLHALLVLAFSSSFASAGEIDQPDLPPTAQIEKALDSHIQVLNAGRNLKIEHANRQKWNSGNYEFNLRAESSQRNISDTGNNQREWELALERPMRLPNKIGIDENIGSAAVEQAEYALGDARHEVGRMLLRLWFTWQREQAQAILWQQQLGILNQQVKMAEKRVKAGDAPKLDLNQAQAAAAQAGVSAHQARLRAQLAGGDLARQFPAIQLPEKPLLTMPQPIEHDLAYWKSRTLEHNHELGMARAQSQVQKLLAQRSRADRVPDPTLGLRYANEAGGNEKVTGVYLAVPFSFGLRSATAESAAQQAGIAADQEAFVRHRLENDIHAAYAQATGSFDAWQQAQEAALAVRNNADLISKAYSLGESSLSDSLTARRLAQEASLAETLAQLDANEARYHLMLDAHELWPLEKHGADSTHDHY